MADWKYVMWQVGDNRYPIIFPNILVHDEVAHACHRLFVDMARSMPPTTIRTPISAGFIPSLAVAGVTGMSESMANLMSKPEDAAIINLQPYTALAEQPMGSGLEQMLLIKHIEFCIARAKGED